jgi:hypothetical protein
MEGVFSSSFLAFCFFSEKKNSNDEKQERGSWYRISFSGFTFFFWLAHDEV